MRFTLRDVLWLMVVVGLACGWLVSSYSQRAYWREWSRKNDEWASEGFKAADQLAAEVQRLRARVATLEATAASNP